VTEVLALGIILAVRRRLSPTVLPLLAGTLLFSALCLLFSWRGGVTVRSGAGINYSLGPDECLAVRHVFLSAAAFILIGHVLTHLLLRLTRLHKPAGRLPPHPDPPLESTLPQGALHSSDSPNRFYRAVNFTLTLTSGLVAVHILAYGQALLDRPTYMILGAATVTGAIGYLLMPLAGVVAYTTWHAEGRRFRIWGHALFLSIFILEFCRASRSASIILLLGALVQLTRRRPHVKRLLIAAPYLFSAFLTLGLVLQLRGLQRQGLIPYLQYVLSGQASLADNFTAIQGNLLATIPITYLSNFHSLPEGYIQVTLNPLPGTMTNWSYISDYLSINRSTPTNMLGQLSTLPILIQGLLWAYVACLAVLADRIALATPRSSQAVLRPLMTLLTIAALLQYCQYSMRAGLRFQYLAVLVALVGAGLPRFLTRSHQEKVSPLRPIKSSFRFRDTNIVRLSNHTRALRLPR
jgi:hypothetical protein